ncbi:MAG: hypothetical protein ACQESB_07030 [Elusimicrobiota bacterium]
MKIFNKIKLELIMAAVLIALGAFHAGNLNADISRARRLLEKNRITRAKEIAGEILEEEPENEEAKEILNEIDEIDETIEKGLNAITEFIEKDDISSARLRMNDLLHLSGYDERIEELNSRLAQEEAKIEQIYQEVNSFLQKALNNFSERNYQKAKEYVKKVIEYQEHEKIVPFLRQSEEIDEEYEDLDAETLFDSALEDLDAYDMDEAMKKIRTILDYKAAPDIIRYKAFFIEAFIHSFNEDKTAAEITFIDLITQGLSETYTITILPETISQDSELIKLYNMTRQKYEETKGKSYESIAGLVQRGYMLEEDISKINEVIVSARREVVDEIFEISKRFHERGLFLDAARMADKVLKFNPANHIARYIYESSILRLLSFADHADAVHRKVLSESVDNYIAGRYTRAGRGFRQLRKLDPGRFSPIIARVATEEVQYKNRLKADSLILEAERLLKRKFYDEAESKILQAVILDEYNMKGRVLLEEVRFHRARDL